MIRQSLYFRYPIIRFTPPSARARHVLLVMKTIPETSASSFANRNSTISKALQTQTSIALHGMEISNRTHLAAKLQIVSCVSSVLRDLCVSAVNAIDLLDFASSHCCLLAFKTAFPASHAGFGLAHEKKMTEQTQFWTPKILRDLNVNLAPFLLMDLPSVRIIAGMAKQSILVVEDENDLAEMVRYNLEREGFACRVAGDGVAAIEEVRRQRPDLVILDRMLPRKSGDEVANAILRERETADVPIIMLTAKAEEADQLVGFALGAVDYVTKPFSMKILIARVRSALRKSAVGDSKKDVLQAGPIVLNSERFEVTVGGEPAGVTATEFRILKTLMQGEGRVLDRTQLIDSVLGPTVAVTDRTIDVHIAGLRKKLGEEAASWVQTIRGVGYTFRDPG
jgi:DNA-binding response OmpR family regulator